jgi:hypothetical protein
LPSHLSGSNILGCGGSAAQAHAPRPTARQGNTRLLIMSPLPETASEAGSIFAFQAADEHASRQVSEWNASADLDGIQSAAE